MSPILLTAVVFTFTSATFTPIAPGGPPRISVAGKANGDITAAQWKESAAVVLQGCVPTATVTSLSLCIKDCKGGPVTLTTTNGSFTREMKTMIANLPSGTSFTVKVKVKDGSGKEWPVPDAVFVWKG